MVMCVQKWEAMQVESGALCLWLWADNRHHGRIGGPLWRWAEARIGGPLRRRADNKLFALQIERPLYPPPPCTRHHHHPPPPLYHHVRTFSACVCVCGCVGGWVGGVSESGAH